MTRHFGDQRGRSFVPLQKSHWNHASYVWIEALSRMVFDSAQRQSYIGWTQPKSNVDRSSSQLISGCSLWVIRVYLVLAVVKFSRQGRSPFKVINVWHQLSPKRKAKLVFFSALLGQSSRSYRSAWLSWKDSPLSMLIHKKNPGVLRATYLKVSIFKWYNCKIFI